MALKDLKLSLVVEALDRATAPLRRVGQGLKSLQERTEKLKGAMKKLGLAELVGGAFFTGAVVEAGRGIWELTNKTAEMGEGFLHASQKAGVSVEAIQRLGFAAKQLGVDQDALGAVFFRFQTHLANALGGHKETIAALKLLGITLGDVKRLSKDPEEAFMRLSEGFRSIQNPTVRAKLALDLFSRSGYAILPMLMAGREGLQKFGSQLDAAHAVMSEQDAKASEEFVQQKNRMGLALRGLQIQIGTRLLPTMTSMIEKLTQWIEHLQPAVVDRFTRSIEGLTSRLPAMLPRLEHLAEMALRLSERLLKLSANTRLLKGLLAGLAVVMAAQVLVSLVQFVTLLGSGAMWVFRLIGFIRTLVALSAGVRTFAGAMALLDIALDANPVGVLVLAIAGLIAAIAAIAGLVYLVIKHWKGLTHFFQGLWDAVAGIFTNAWRRLESLTPDWIKALIKSPMALSVLAATVPGGAPVAAAIATTSFAQTVAARSAAAGAPGAAGAPARARVDVHVHDDRKPTVKTKAGAGTDIDVHRGALPSG